MRTTAPRGDVFDGFRPRDRVVVTAATNRPDVLDSALVRAGRLERRVEVPLPGRLGRLRILKVASRGLPLAPDVDLTDVASRAPRTSSAFISKSIHVDFF